MLGLTVAERTAQVMEHIAEHDSHGYSQPNRSGDGTIETVSLSDGSYVSIHGGDYDCSESARVCVNCALTGRSAAPIEYMWTGNEDEELRANGFVRFVFDSDKVQRGDVLWVSGHTGIALGKQLQADAHGDENGGITGPRQGDQTGHEVEIRSLRYTWTYMYRYFGKEPFIKEEPTVVEIIKEVDDGMKCLINIKNRNTVVFFDGININDLTHPDNIAVLRKIYRTCYDKEMPVVDLTEDEFARLCQAIKGSYPKHLKVLVDKFAPRSPEA